MKRIVLIDGSNLLFRMFYGIPSEIKNSKGYDIRGLIGFLGSLKKFALEFEPNSMFVVFDSQTSKVSNLEIDASYKANRVDYSDVPSKENPYNQLPLIEKALLYLGIGYLEVETYEADDFIASLASRDENCEYIIISTDTDFIQLVNDHIYLYVPRGKMSVLYDREKIVRKYKILPNRYIHYKSLVGDRSDNIKGVHGIGNVSASKILGYPSIEDFINNNVGSRLSKLILENIELIRKNIKLITLNKQLDTSFVVLSKLSRTILDSKTYDIVEKIGEK